MADVKDWLSRSVQRFADNVATVGDDDWARSTPNDDWDVRALVAHVTDEHLWMPGLLAGQTVDDLAGQIPSDPLGDDPVTAFGAASAAGLAAADAVDLDATVHLSFGDFPAEEYLMQLFADHLIHAWDLARATGQDDTIAGQDLAEMQEAIKLFPEEAMRSPGAFGPEIEAPADASDQDKLMAFLGRQP